MIETKPKIRGKVTQRDIAEAIGVSHVAVSHVLHRPHQARISPDTKRDILRMARQMGYQPRGATTHTITLVVQPEGLWTDVTTNILMAADELLHKNGYRMSVSTLGEGNIKTAAELFSPKTVDGVIFTEWYGKASQCLHALRVPWLLLADTAGLDSRVDQVALDTVGASRRLAEYLLARGHEKFFVMTGKTGIGFHDRFLSGALEALKAAGLPAANAVIADASPDADIEEVLQAHLKGKQPPSAVMAAAPGNALVALNRLHRLGYQVPEQASLVSLIDSPRLEALRPAITATTAVGHETVKLAVERIIERIKEPDLEAQHIFTSGEIISRESVARVTYVGK